MTRKRWMILAWAAILAGVIAFAALDGGRNCQVPKSGPFHWLLKGEAFVPTHAGRYRCKQVK